MKVDIRKLIVRRLKAMGKTRYWLSHNQTAAHPATVQAYLSGRRGTSDRVVSELLNVVGLSIAAK